MARKAQSLALLSITLAAVVVALATEQYKAKVGLAVAVTARIIMITPEMVSQILVAVVADLVIQ
jgi:hypothetical protein